MLNAVGATKTISSNPLQSADFLVLPPRPLNIIGKDIFYLAQAVNPAAVNPDQETKENEIKATVVVPDKKEGIAWIGQKLLESVVYSFGDYALIVTGVTVLFFWGRRKDSLRKFHDQILTESVGFFVSANNNPAIYFKQFEPEDLTEILDKSATSQVKKAIKESKKDLLPFVVFRHRSQKSPHDIIGRSIRQWVEGFMGESAIDTAAPKDRLKNGIQPTNTAGMIQYFGFFTCDELGSTEQLCMIPLQAEDLLNILIDLPNWWKTTEQESKLEERDSKIRLARMVEFAVALATRYPLALMSCLNQYEDKVRFAIKNAERLEKLLAVLPKETVQWIDDFIDHDYLDGSKELPAIYRLSESERVEVMRDWFCIKDENRCRELAEIEKAATSFDQLIDIGVKNKIPMWFIMPRKYLPSELLEN